MPGFGRRSRRDNANALVALHAKMLLHLLNHAALTVLHEEWCRFCFALRKASEELCCLGGPPPSRFDSKHHQARPTTATNQLWIGGLLPPPGLFQCQSWTGSCSPSRRSVAVEERHQRGVDGKLGSLHSDNPSAITSILRPSSRKKPRSGLPAWEVLHAV